MQDFCLIVNPHSYVKAQIGSPDGQADFIHDLDMQWEKLCNKG